ncbi:RNA methyltransferase [Palleniella muris]|uniref:RNA methyltransferase n=1 Tax=Palleniella muris TaxID=3038145 RepID=A0AC61QT98_9BACT|nr:RNA methyltransferase [Palleniella muris]TGX83481.1 RNA methyltransferase [Palleniella muris]
MISKAKIKFIRTLENKKARRDEGLFVAEGPKVVGDLMKVASPKIIVATEQWLGEESKSSIDKNTEIYTVTSDELRKVSFLQHPQQVLAVFEQNFLTENKDEGLSFLNPNNEDCLVLGLDSVQDPGNLGTIIRIADWFGIERIICSPDTVDVWNPKVVQATMGSIARVKVTYRNLHDVLDEIEVYNSSLSSEKPFPVYGTLLDGKDITTQPLENYGLVIMGNEGNGISPDIAARVSHKLLIPNYPKGRETADSLNVAIATAITCFALRR